MSRRFARSFLPESLVGPSPFLPFPDEGGDGGGGAPANDGGSQDPAPGTGDGAGEGEKDWKAEADRYKALMRKQEERAKANSKAAEELEKLREAGKSEQEKAISAAQAEARKTGEAEAAVKYGARLVQSEFRAILADGRGLVGDRVQTLTEHLAPGQFLGDDGEIDVAALTRYADAVAPKQEPGTGGQQWPSLGQGTRGGQPAKSVASGMARYYEQKKQQAGPFGSAQNQT